MPRVLSFDIGIKHLAYCVVDFDSISTKIIQWDVISLLTESSTMDQTNLNPCTCQTIEPKKGPCSKPAAFFSKGANPIYCCKVHANKNPKFHPPSPQRTATFINHLSLEDLATLYKKEFPQGTATTKKQRAMDLKQHMEETTWKTVPPKSKSGDIPLVTLGRNLKRLLTAAHFENITHVLIENQIGPLANRMKCLQGMLTQYFIMTDPTDSIHIVPMSSSLKLKGLVDIPPTGTTTSTYKTNKNNSVEICGKILNSYPEFEEWRRWWGHRVGKCDDLSDAFLQAMAWIKINKSNQFSHDASNTR